MQEEEIEEIEIDRQTDTEALLLCTIRNNSCFSNTFIALPCLSDIQSLYSQYQYLTLASIFHVSQNLAKVFQKTFYLLLTNSYDLTPWSTPSNPFGCDYCWWPCAKQTTNSKMYAILAWINKLTAIWRNMLARIWRQQCIFFFFVITSSIFPDMAHLCSFIVDIFCFVHNLSE